MSRKNLDKLFREKFSSFQELPDEKVWQTIEASLNEKDKKRRIIPIWWKIGSIAAILALGFFLINPLSKNDAISPSIITETSKPTQEEEQNSNKKNAQELIENTKENTTITDINSNTSEEKNTILNPSKSIITATNNTKQNAVTKTSTVSEGEELNNPSNTKYTKDEKSIVPSILNTKETGIAQVSKDKKTDSNSQEIVTSMQKDIEKTKNETNSIAVNDKQKSTPIKEVAKKSIYDEIKAQKEDKEDAIAEVKTNKWSAGATVAPVYFNAIGDGSPVGSIFVSNSKSGDTNLSYGLSIAYEVSSKLSVRSGIHKVDYAYNTNDVSFSSNFNGSVSNQLSTINYDSSSSNLELLSTDAEAVSNSPKNSFAASDVSSKNPTREGVMSQQFDYLEVPLELKYRLVNSKFGVDIIGGVSSLFLLDNSVLLSSESITTTLGEANNMNSVNFSTNIGVGLNYKFTPKIKINVEPMFKYQLNTFSSTNGTFEPYSIGIYSGLTFKF